MGAGGVWSACDEGDDSIDAMVAVRRVSRHNFTPERGVDLAGQI